MSLYQLFQALGLTVLHMLWIGTVIGGLAFVWLRSNPNADPRTRYACVVGGLSALMVGTVSTFAFLASTNTVPARLQTAAAIGSVTEFAGSSVERSARSRDLDIGSPGMEMAPTSMIACAWLAGIALMSVRLFRQWAGVRRLRIIGVSEPSTAWATRFDALKSKIGVRSRVSMLVSDIVDAPMVVGWLRPLVLVPATAFTSLTPDQLQTVLAHELYHIARRDHLVNMLQAFIEVLLFFHPVTWWLSRQIRVERENCCDDSALLVTGSPRTFAEALLALESLRADHNKINSPQLLTATGGLLMHRISRLFGSNQPQSLNAGWRAVSACTLLAVAGLTFGTAITDPIALAQDRGGSDARDIDLDELKAGIEARIKAMGERLAEQVAAGEISEADAKARFEEGEKRMWMRYRAAEERNATRGNSEVDYEAAVMKMTEMVKNGEITKEQMQQRLDRMKRAGSPTEAADRIDLDELKAEIEERLRAMGADLRKQVAAGEISEEDAKARFAEGESRMWMRYRAAEEKNAGAMKGDAKTPQIDLDELKAKIEERVRAMGADLRKQVAAGEMSEEDARAKFAENEKRMWMRYRAAEEKNAFAMKGDAKTPRIDLDELKAKIEERVRAMGADLRKQVAAGGMSEEDARARFAEGEKRMWMRYRAAEEQNATRGKSEVDYEAAAERMIEMVKNGEITKEQMQQRLDRMTQADSKDKKAGDRRRSRTDYDAAVRKMTEMVKNGEITREQMQQRLDRMKQAGE
jgi:beta-lactamase regulating signal transducer with metallopeptidase domain